MLDFIDIKGKLSLYFNISQRKSRNGEVARGIFLTKYSCKVIYSRFKGRFEGRLTWLCCTPNDVVKINNSKVHGDKETINQFQFWWKSSNPSLYYKNLPRKFFNFEVKLWIIIYEESRTFPSSSIMPLWYKSPSMSAYFNSFSDSFSFLSSFSLSSKILSFKVWTWLQLSSSFSSSFMHLSSSSSFKFCLLLFLISKWDLPLTAKQGIMSY